MNIKYRDILRYKGKAFADIVLMNYKNGDIKTMADLLVFYGINKKGKGDE